MSIAFQERDDEIGLALEGVIDITCAADLKSSLLAALKTGKPVRFSFDRCAGLDITTYQLLWAAAREARSQSLHFALEGEVPAGLAASLREAGFDTFPISA